MPASLANASGEVEQKLASIKALELLSLQRRPLSG